MPPAPPTLNCDSIDHQRIAEDACQEDEGLEEVLAKLRLECRWNESRASALLLPPRLSPPIMRGADERHDGVALRWASSAARRAWDAGSKERLSDSTRTACLRPAF